MTRLNKKRTETNLLSTEYVALQNNTGELKATFQTENELTQYLKGNQDTEGYIFKTYKLTTKNKI